MKNMMRDKIHQDRMLDQEDNLVFVLLVLEQYLVLAKPRVLFFPLVRQLAIRANNFYLSFDVADLFGFLLMILKKFIYEYFSILTILLNFCLLYHKNQGSDRFSRFNVCWIEAKQETNKPKELSFCHKLKSSDPNIFAT